MVKQKLALFLSLLLCSGIHGQNEKPEYMLNWTYPYPVHTVRILDSLEIAYIDEGAGEYTLFFVHGMGSYLKSWTKNIEALKLRYRCVALDLPGYGKSSAGVYPQSMTFFADAARGLIERLRLENVVLVGHSMGGQIGMHVAIRGLPQLEKLVLIAPAGFETFTEAEKRWFESVYTPAFIQTTPATQIERNFELNFFQMPDDARFMIEDRLLLRETAAYETYCDMIPRCVRGMLDEPVYERLPDITLPTLILFGNDDALIPNRFLHPTLSTAEVARDGQSRIPGSELRLLDACGHFVQWECADEVNAVIEGFLR
jgi:pimeloyl-ACP methyl ester carboxylesterase